MSHVPDGAPPLGLQGTYQGACFVCLTGTDTGFALHTTAHDVRDVLAAFLLRMGVSIDEACQVAGTAPLSSDGMIAIRCCARCAEPLGPGLQVGHVDQIPAYEYNGPG